MVAATMTLLATSWSSGAPFVRVREHGTTASEVRPLIGLTLQYEASGERVCLGHTPFRTPSVEYVDCTLRPVPGSRRCRRCTAVETAFAANLHHAHTRDAATLDRSVAEHLRQTNLLYLAGFADGTIKVGTSTLARVETRLAEQGAWAARLVAEAANGVAVREMEDRVTEEVGLPQSVSVRRKIDGIVHPVPSESLTFGIGQMTGAVHRLLPRIGGDDLAPIDRAWSHPTASDERWRGVHPYPLRADVGEHNFTIVQACGRVVALQRPNSAGDLGADVFVADIGVLFGVVLEVGSYEPPEIMVQDSLF